MVRALLPHAKKKELEKEFRAESKSGKHKHFLAKNIYNCALYKMELMTPKIPYKKEL